MSESFSPLLFRKIKYHTTGNAHFNILEKPLAKLRIKN